METIEGRVLLVLCVTVVAGLVLLAAYFLTEDDDPDVPFA